VWRLRIVLGQSMDDREIRSAPGAARSDSEGQRGELLDDSRDWVSRAPTTASPVSAISLRSTLGATRPGFGQRAGGGWIDPEFFTRVEPAALGRVGASVSARSRSSQMWSARGERAVQEVPVTCCRDDDHQGSAYN
jgi:hypothetical protein